MYMYIYMCMCTCICIYIYTYLSINESIFWSIHVPLYLSTYPCSHAYVYLFLYVYMYVYIYILTYIHTYGMWDVTQFDMGLSESGAYPNMSNRSNYILYPANLWGMNHQRRSPMNNTEEWQLASTSAGLSFFPYSLAIKHGRKFHWWFSQNLHVVGGFRLRCFTGGNVIGVDLPYWDIPTTAPDIQNRMCTHKANVFLSGSGIFHVI